ncbi:hypothetical protein DHEL01_v203094 [Diaporthe helianthi]|uniref:Uncharacterized protein n=1 Tax=Diaporthe helianthi TaxID=158607 RepID=A0A2P5I7Q5_DIAHE|nr:hypothetical protein DHEL01_v203094 [Diaporthe helianthi]
MKSEFDLISLKAFRQLCVRDTAYGSKFTRWLPLTLSKKKHWGRVKDDAYRSLNQLARLLISDVETNRNFQPRLFLQAVTRNVPRLLAGHPELEHMEYPTSPYRLHHTFAADSAQYHALVFMHLFQQTIRDGQSTTPAQRQTIGLDKLPDVLEEQRD